MQISSKLLYKTAILLLALLMVTMVLVVISQANAASSLPSDTNWNTVKTAINSYITGQFGAGGAEGEAGFTIDNAGLKPRIDSNGDNNYLGEGDDAKNAPVLIDNLMGFTTIIPATSYRCAWNSNCFEDANVATVKGLVDAHAAAGFSTDTVVYCGSGHTEAPTTGAYGFIANASDGAGGYGLSSAGNGISKVYAFKWGRNGWTNTLATYANSGAMAAAEASTATNTVTPYAGCGSPTSDADLVRCEARYAIYKNTSGGRYATVVNGNNTGPASINTALGAGGQSVDIRTGPPALTTDITGNQISVPLDTLFNSGLTNLDGTATTLIVGSTPMVSGIAAQGVNMLGYNMVAGTFVNGGMPGWKSTENEKQAAQTAYVAPAIAGWTSPGKMDTTNPVISGLSATATGSTTADVTRTTTGQPSTSKIQLDDGSGGALEVDVNSTVLNEVKTVKLYGLVPGTTYTGTLTVYDAQANSASTAISITTPASGGTSDLSLGAPAASWGSYADYLADVLSVDWTITNNGLTTVRLRGRSNTVALSLVFTPPSVAGILTTSVHPDKCGSHFTYLV
ncbi:MAG: hypothetical protein WC828_02460 [Thermoleophilia bacterium]